MRWTRQLQLRLRALLRRRAVEKELAEELRVHVEEQTAVNRRAGMSAAEARRRALADFGGVDQISEECREARGVSWLENLFRDTQFALRMLRKSPGFATAAVLTLALGIGANTAIFSVVNSVLLRPLPYTDPSRLVLISESHRKTREISVNYLDFHDWQAQSKTFEQFTILGTRGFNLTGTGQPDRLSGRAVSSNFLATLGVKPFLGRDFLASEDRPGGDPVVILTYGLWLDRFGGDRSLIGKTLTLNDRSYTVIGILPAEAKLPLSGDILSLLGQESGISDSRMSHAGLYVFGRMKPGVTLDEARAEMDSIAAGLAQAYPDSNTEVGVMLTPLREVFVANSRAPILVLMAAVSLVLLIACFNVANLQLARAASREREFAIRRAIGASRGRILRQLLTESVLLAFLGASLGLLLAVWMLASLTRLLPAGVTRVIPVTLDGPVLAFTSILAPLSGILFGLVPALHASGVSLHDALKESARTASSGMRRGLFRHLLVVSEIALSLVLLLSAGLMIRSLRSLGKVNPGFDAQNALTMRISLPSTRYPNDEAVRNFYKQLLERTAQLPGVKNTAVVLPLLLTGQGWQDGFYLESEPVPAPGHLHSSDYHYVSPGYFRTMGIPILKGRDFTASDDSSSPRVAVISKEMATQYWPGEDPIGKRFHKGHPGSPESEWLTVVGVVGNTKQYGLETPTKTEFYVSYLQRTLPTMYLVVRTESGALEIAQPVRSVVQSLDASQPVYDIRTLAQLLDDDGATRQTSSRLLGVFALIALALAAIGIYGVMSYSVSERTHEVGVRMALGAQPGDVLRLLIGQGVRLAAIGVVVGLAAALAAGPVLKNILFGVSPTDAVTFALVPPLLACVALAACYIPTRRATKVDAMVALRYE